MYKRQGWKGAREGDAGVHRLQALVLVNYGSATGAQLLQLAQRIPVSYTHLDVYKRQPLMLSGVGM